MPPKSKTTFHALEARLASFSEAKIRGVKGRGKQRVSSWPHESPTPVALAEAGFYYNPAIDSNDNITCFLCQTSLDSWEENDDPVQEHYKNSKNCAWAFLRSNSWTKKDATTISTSDLNPNSDFSLNCRLETFSEWPHEKKQGWHPTGLIMARAGFYYNPIQPGDDEASCCYCGINLDAWEQDDNPVEEHKKRSPDCLCFQSIMEIATPMADRSTRSAVSGAFYSSAAAAESDDEENESILHINKMKSRKRGAEHDGEDDSDAPFRKVSRTDHPARIVSTASVATVTELNVKEVKSQKSFNNENEHFEVNQSVAEHDESVCLIPASKLAATAVTSANESAMSISTVADSSMASSASSTHIPGAFPVPKKKRGRPRKIKPTEPEQVKQAPTKKKEQSGELHKKKLQHDEEYQHEERPEVRLEREHDQKEHREASQNIQPEPDTRVRTMDPVSHAEEHVEADQQHKPSAHEPVAQSPLQKEVSQAQRQASSRDQSPQYETQLSVTDNQKHTDGVNKEPSTAPSPLRSIADSIIKHSSISAASSEAEGSISTATSAYQSFDDSPRKAQHSSTQSEHGQECDQEGDNMLEDDNILEDGNALKDDQMDAGISDQDNNWEQFSSSSISTRRPTAPVVSFYSEPDEESVGHSASGPTTPVRETAEPKWTLADVDAVFSVINETLDESSAQLSQQEMNKPLIDWTRELAMRQSDQLKQKCETIIKILEQEGARAIQAVQSMPVRS